MSTSSNSGNSTSLYGEAGTPIPDSSGNVVVRGDLIVLSGNILTTATTGNIFPANATTINLGLAATAMNIGAATGTTTINNALTAGGTVTAPGADFGNITIGVATNNTITTTSGDLDITAVGTAGVNIVSGTAAPTLITRDSVATSSSIRSLALAVQSSGTPTVGFGNTLDFQLEAQPGNLEQAGYIAVISTDLTAASEDFSMSFGLMQNGSAYTSKMSLNSAGNLAIDGDLTVGGVNINLAPSTNFLYSENNNRTNRLEVQSTTGNSSGFRVRAPNTSTSASSTLSANNSSDSANTEFIALQARGSALGDTFRFLTGEYIANVLSASNKSISFTDYTNTYATVNPAGPTIGTDLATKTYVDNAVITTGVASITGTANQVIASSPTGAVTLSLPQDIDTTSNVEFALVKTGHIETNEIRPFDAADTDVRMITSGSGIYQTGKADIFVSESAGYPDGLAVISVNSNLWYFVDDGSTQFPNYIFPAADGAVNEVLTTDGSGNLSWTLPGGGGSTFGNITVAVVDDNTISTTTGDLDITATGNNGVNITSGSDAPTLITRNSTLTTGNTRSLSLSVQSSGTPTVGFGNNLEFQIETAPSVDTAGGYLSVTSTDLTPGSENFKMSFGLMQNGATYAEKAFIDSAGNMTLDGELTTTKVVTPAIQNTSGSVVITGGAVTPSVLTLDDTQTTLALDGGVGYGDSTLTTAFNALTWAHTAGVLDIGSVNGTWQLGLDGKTYFPNYNLPYVSGAVNTVLTNDGLGNVTWALPGGGGSTFGNVTVGVDTDQTISTTSGNLVLQTAAGVNAGTMTLTAGANGAITLAPNGTGNVVNTFSNGGNITNDRNYVFGAIRNATTQTTNGDIWELNTAAAQSATNPYFRGVSLDNSADTTRGPATLMRSYSGGAVAGSASRGRLIFEKARGTAATPSAVQSGDLIGSIDATGYSSTGWLNDTVPAVSAFFGFAAAENWVSNTALGTTFSLNIAPTSTTISTGANLIPVLALNPQSATYRSDTHTFQQGKTGTTALMDLSATRANFSVPVQFPSYTAAAANLITGAVGRQIAITNSPTVGGRMAFWDTTNARWSYISDNTAV